MITNISQGEIYIDAYELDTLDDTMYLIQNATIWICFFEEIAHKLKILRFFRH